MEATLPLKVGVFTDATADEIAWVVEEVGLDGVQLHGVLGPGGKAVRASRRRLGETAPHHPGGAGGSRGDAGR